MNPKVEFLDRTKKKKLVHELEKIYGINEIPQNMHANNFMQVYIDKRQFMDYCHLKKDKR